MKSESWSLVLHLKTTLVFIFFNVTDLSERELLKDRVAVQDCLFSPFHSSADEWGLMFLSQPKFHLRQFKFIYLKIHPSAPVGHSTESFQCARGNPCPHMQLQLLSFVAALLYMEMIILSSLRYGTELCCLWEFRQNILPLGMWDLWRI